MGLVMDEETVDSGEPGELVIASETVAVDELQGAGIPLDDENEPAATGPQGPLFGYRRRFESTPEYIPTPFEIQEACRQIRMCWKPGERYRRLIGQWDEVDQ